MICVDHLTKRFAAVTAVDDVSFRVQPGEVFALLGPNGSGKTTTLKSIVGLVVPTAGAITIGGLDSRKQARRARELTSYLPQRVVFPENLTVRETIRFFSRIRNLSPDVADRALRDARFNGSSDKIVSELSGGMMQRLALAIVSLPQAPVMILDEPTASLDPVGVKRFREFVLEQKKKGTTILFSTHLLAEAEQLADRIAVYVGGKIVALRTKEEIRREFLATGTIEDMYLHYVELHDHESL